MADHSCIAWPYEAGVALEFPAAIAKCKHTKNIIKLYGVCGLWLQNIPLYDRQ